MREHVREWIDITGIKGGRLIWFRNDALKIILIAFEKESFFEQLSLFQILQMFRRARFFQLRLDGFNLIFQIGSPLLDNLVDEQVVWIKLLNFVHILLGLFIKVKITDTASEAFIYHRISHFPQRQRTSLKELFNSELGILEKHFGSKISIGQSLKYSLLYLLVDNILFISPVKQGPILSNLWVEAFFDIYAEDSIRIAVQSLHLNIVTRL